MLAHISILFVFLSLFNNALCQLPFPDTCPDVKVVDTFDVDAYMGIWYEYSKYPFIYELGKKCQYANYKNNGDNTVAVQNFGTWVFTNKTSSVKGTAKVFAPGQLGVAFKNQTVDKPNYLVLGTDYTNWVVVYSCRNISSIANAKIIWILTRERQPAPEIVEKAKKVIADNKLSTTFLIKSNQKDCWPVGELDASTTTLDDQQTSASTTNSFNDQSSTIDFTSASTPANFIEAA